MTVCRTAVAAAVFTACVGATAAATATAAPAADDGRNFELISKSLPSGRQAVEVAPVVVPGADQAVYSVNPSDDGSRKGQPTIWVGRLGSGGWEDRQLALPGRTVSTAGVTFLDGQEPDGDLLLRATAEELDPTVSDPQGGTYRVDPWALTAQRLIPLETGAAVRGGNPATGSLVVTGTGALAPEGAGVDPDSQQVFERIDGGYRLVSVLPSGQPAPPVVDLPSELRFRAGPNASFLGDGIYAPIAGGRRHMVSADGRRVFFTAGDFPSFPAATTGPLYRNDAGTGTVAISASQRGADAGALSAASFVGASRDGDVVFFTAAKPLEGAAEGPALYRAVLSTGNLSRLTPELPAASSAPPAENPTPTLPLDVRSAWASEDGSTVVFVATNAFAPGAVEGNRNAYAARGGQLRFVGDLGQDGTVERISRTGDFAVLSTTANAAGASTGGFSQLFRYDWPRDELRCVSCRVDGTPNQGLSSVARVPELATSIGRLTAPRAIADDGRVFFTSKDRLVTHDPSPREDAYEFTDAGLRMLSTGEGYSFVVDNTDDGGSVFVNSSDALTAEDADAGDLDLYVRRAGAAPYIAPAVAATCSGDACQGPAAAAGAAPPAPASDRVGAGNVQAAPRPVLLGAPRVTSAQRRVLARGKAARVTVRLRGPGRLVVTATTRGRKVARASVRVRRATTVTARVDVRLSRTARRFLREDGRLRIRVSAALDDARRATVLTLRRGSR